MRSKKELVKRIIVVFLFVVGVGIFLYPTVTGFVNEQSQTRVISNYQEAMEALSDDDKTSAIERAVAYNNALAQSQTSISDPFEDTSVESGTENQNAVEVVSLLSIGEVMGYIQIPKIGIKLPIYEGVSEAVLQKGIGWLTGTSLPVGGESTHSVLSGHRGLPTSKLFTDLDKMEYGDEFFVVNSSEILAYRVCSVEVINPEEVSALSIVEGEDIVTLLTCHPYMINNQRLLVTGERIPYTGQLDEIEEGSFLENMTPAEKDLFLTVAIIGLLSVVLVLLVWRPWNRRKRKEGGAVHG